MKLKLPNVTLLGIDCLDVARLQAAMDVCEMQIEFGAVKLLSSLESDDKQLVKIPTIHSLEEYSRVCVAELHTHVDTEFVLLVQYDGFILDPEMWTDEFLEFDYIGAPISWSEGKLSVGNGGFSLRSKRFLEASARLCNEGKIDRVHPEDMALCVWYRELLETEGIRFAPVHLGMKFSVVEDHGVYEQPFGFHGLFKKNISSLLSKHPDYPIHYFLPRRREKLLQKIQSVFEGVAKDIKITKTSDTCTVDIILPENTAEDVLRTYQEYYSKVGDIASLTNESEGGEDRAVRSEVVYRTQLGDIRIHYHLYI